MFTKLPQEILLQVTKYLTFKDIIVLSIVDKSIYIRLINDSKHIIENELVVYFNSKYKKHHFSIMMSDLMFSLSCTDYSGYTNLNEINWQVISFFNAHGTLFGFKNAFTLFSCFIYMETKFFSKVNIPYIINNSLYIPSKKVLLDYYTFILQSDCILHFDILYNISQKAISACSLRKLFGYKQLSLITTKFVRCCPGYFCLRELVTYIVLLKYNLQKDPLIDYNYKEIKTMCLINDMHELYELILNAESEIINAQITIKNPFTNRRDPVNSLQHTDMINELYRLKRYKHVANINRTIRCRRRRVRRIVFG